MKRTNSVIVDHTKVREAIDNFEKEGTTITISLLAKASGYRYEDLYSYECYMKYLNPRALAKRAQAIIDRKKLIEELERALAASGEKEIQLMPSRRGRPIKKNTTVEVESKKASRRNFNNHYLEELENRLARQGISPTFDNIGNLMGLTRQRVQQIYKAHGRARPLAKQNAAKLLEIQAHLKTLDVKNMTKKEIYQSFSFAVAHYFVYSLIKELPYKRAHPQSAFIVAVKESGIDPNSMSAPALARKLGFSHLRNPYKQLQNSGMR
jgi:hypothetical protein